MIERGAYELREAILASHAATEAEKVSARKLYQDIIVLGFSWQRTGLVDEISRQEDEEIQERLEEKEKLFITKAEYEKMIMTLREQMHVAAKSEEYHRAAMIKDRITELDAEMKKARDV